MLKKFEYKACENAGKVHFWNQCMSQTSSPIFSNYLQILFQ